MFDLPTYTHHLDAVDSAATSADKGASLEALLAYLFSAVPGFLDMERNVLNAFATEELDIAVMHAAAHDGFPFVNPVFLVECKNWSDSVGSSVISYFAGIVKNRGCDVGIFVAAHGITGNPAGPTAGTFEVAVALAKDGIKILVVTLEDLRSVETVDDFVKLLRRRYLQLIASGTFIPS